MAIYRRDRRAAAAGRVIFFGGLRSTPTGRAGGAPLGRIEMRVGIFSYDIKLGVFYAASAVGVLGGCGAAQNSEDPQESRAEALTAGTVVAYEAENLTRTASAIGSKITADAAASGGKYVEFNGTAATGAWLEFTLTNVAAGAYDLKFLYKANSNRGIVQTSIDGVNQGTACNEYAAAPAFKVACALGSKTLTAGDHRVRFTVTGKASTSSGYQMVVDQLSLTAKGANGPCDIYAAAGTSCVAAYSMVRTLSSNYVGPLYQVRSGSSDTNTGTGGVTKDIRTTPDGYADSAAQDSFCAGSICTVSILYDQSGNRNDLRVAKRGLADGGTHAAQDDYESSATKSVVTAGGHRVHALYMSRFEGYRTAVGVIGANMPRGTAAQGIYELVDGTRVGTACCWDFGNVSTDPTKYGGASALFFGTAFWGRGAGNGPWFMADFSTGIWAGGSQVGDPGWGDFSAAHPPNPNNPTLKVPFALGFLKTSSSQYAIRVADAQTASALVTAYEGPPPLALNNLGGIVLGVDAINSNNSWGTFYEGAIVAGYPSASAELAVLTNVKAVGYNK